MVMSELPSLALARSMMRTPIEKVPSLARWMKSRSKSVVQRPKAELLAMWRFAAISDSDNPCGEFEAVPRSVCRVGEPARGCAAVAAACEPISLLELPYTRPLVKVLPNNGDG